MRYIGRMFCYLTVGLGVLAAQEMKPDAVKLPAPMEQALARIAKPVPAAPKQPEVLTPRVEARLEKRCSIPLIAMRIEHPEQFTIVRITPRTIDPMPEARVPAPACETANP